MHTSLTCTPVLNAPERLGMWLVARGLGDADAAFSTDAALARLDDCFTFPPLVAPPAFSAVPGKKWC